MAFERDVLTAVTERPRRVLARPPRSPRQAATAAETTRAVRSLFATVERYPQIHSAGNVLALQEEIERLEGMLADRRELYNDQVYRLNARIAQVPAVLLAGIFGWKPRPSSTPSPDADDAPARASPTRWATRPPRDRRRRGARWPPPPRSRAQPPGANRPGSSSSVTGRPTGRRPAATRAGRTSP